MVGHRVALRFVPCYGPFPSYQEESMKKKTKKRAPATVKNSPVPFSLARAYGARIAKRVATELTPARSTRKKTSR